MAKVTFEFDDQEDNYDILLVTNRHKLVSALYQLNEFYRKLYNGRLYTDELITIKDGKVLTEDDYNKYAEAGEYPVKGTKEYLSTDYLENELDCMLCNARHLLDE